jgi:hypothetical protein
MPIPTFIAELLAGGARISADELASHAMTSTAAKAQAGVAVAQQAYERLYDIADEDDERKRR